MSDESWIVIVDNLTVAYDREPVLENVNIKIPKGKITAIIGPNGAGKSTLLKSLLNLIKPLSGNISYNIDGSIKNKICYIPQCRSVDWDFPVTVSDLVLMGRYGSLGWVKRPKKNDHIIVQQMLKKVGIEELAKRQISRLSGGQQQRAFLARALVQQGEIYLLDEPFKGVDAKTEKIIISLLKELKEQGKTIIIVHHDLQTVWEYFDWVILINTQIVEQGSVSEVFNNENILKTYIK